MFPLPETTDGKIVCYTLTKDFLIYGTDVKKKEGNVSSCYDSFVLFLERYIKFFSY
jgi:hypothetical protein